MNIVKGATRPLNIVKGATRYAGVVAGTVVAAPIVLGTAATIAAVQKIPLFRKSSGETNTLGYKKTEPFFGPKSPNTGKRSSAETMRRAGAVISSMFAARKQKATV